MIENDDKTLDIISEEEIDRYISNVTRHEMTIPFSVLEDALKIFESLGYGYRHIKLVLYDCADISRRGLLLIAENGKFGIKLK